MRRLLFPFFVLLAFGGFAAFAGPALACDNCDSRPMAYDAAGTAELVALANQERSGAGLAPLTMRGDIAEIAAAHTAEMAKSGSIYHNDAYFSSSTRSRLGLKALGENVGMAGSVRGAHQALMNSAPHRANILNGSFTVGGFAVVTDGGAYYVTEAFGTPSGSPPKAASASTPVAAPARPAAPKATAAPKPAPRPAARPAPAATRPAPAPTTPPTAPQAPPVAEVVPPPAAPETPPTTVPERVFTALTSAGSAPGSLAFPAIALLAAVGAAILRTLRQSNGQLVTVG